MPGGRGRPFPGVLYRRVKVTGGGGTGFVAANPAYDLPAYLGRIRAGAFRARDPALVVIEGGGNDVGRPLRKIKRRAKQVLRLARSIHPDAQSRPKLTAPPRARQGR